MKSLRSAIWFALVAAVVAAAMVACARAEMDVPSRAFAFQVANHSASLTRADVSEYDEQTSFGAYSWYKGESEADNIDFMTNEKVSFVDGVWRTTEASYYWPKGGSLDFICYSPYFAENGPAVAENSITWNSWSVTENPTVDLMYATKAPHMTAPTTTYYYKGVPTLFHHALAKVGFKLRLAYDEVEAAAGDKTRWEVDIHSMKISNIYGSGSLTLALNEDGQNWDKPTSNAWTTSGEPAEIALDCSQLPTLKTTDVYEIGTPKFVLPQSLGTDQRVVMVVTIRTYRDIGDGYNLFLTEDHVSIAGELSSSAITSWGINQNITYTFILAPSYAQSTGTDLDGDGIIDQEPTVVYFDPAVNDWENVELTASIQL